MSAARAWGRRAASGTVRGLERVVRGAGMEGSEAREVVVLEYMLPLGCCVHLTPFYEAIKTRRPEVRLTVATRGLGAELLRHHRYVDHVLVTPSPLTDLPGAARSLRGQMRAAGIRPDWVLTGASDQRSRIALLAVAAGGVRAGFTVTEELYHRPLRYNRGRSLIDNNLRLAEMLGAEGEHVEPRIFFSGEEAERARELLRAANPEGRPVLVMVTQTSGGQRTGWHRDRFAEVIRFAAAEMGMAIVYVGTAADAGAIDGIREAAGGRGVSVAGRTSVPELAALLALSDGMISLDTGTMHVGRSVGLPMVVIGPSWQRPLEWMPIGVPQARILRGADRESVPPDYQLDEVGAPEVKGALRELLEAFPPSELHRSERLRRGLCDADRIAGQAG